MMTPLSRGLLALPTALCKNAIVDESRLSGERSLAKAAPARMFDPTTERAAVTVTDERQKGAQRHPRQRFLSQARSLGRLTAVMLEQPAEPLFGAHLQQGHDLVCDRAMLPLRSPAAARLDQ